MDGAGTGSRARPESGCDLPLHQDRMRAIPSTYTEKPVTRQHHESQPALPLSARFRHRSGSPASRSRSRHQPESPAPGCVPAISLGPRHPGCIPDIDATRKSAPSVSPTSRSPRVPGIVPSAPDQWSIEPVARSRRTLTRRGTATSAHHPSPLSQRPLPRIETRGKRKDLKSEGVSQSRRLTIEAVIHPGRPGLKESPPATASSGPPVIVGQNTPGRGCFGPRRSTGPSSRYGCGH